MGCLMQNILEIWNFDENIIGNLTKEDIINAINLITISAASGHESDFVSLLGGLNRNATGHIISATALKSHWMVYINFLNVDHNKIGNDAGTEEWVSVNCAYRFIGIDNRLIISRVRKKLCYGKMLSYRR